jgi:hypothetical protein
MRLTVYVLIGVLIALAIAYFLFMRNRFLIFPKSDGSSVTLGPTGVSFAPPPDHILKNGLDHLQPYISRLVVLSKRYKALSIFTPDGKRGFGLSAKDGSVQAGLTVEWRQEPQCEAKIRSFFSSLGVAPSQDYLAGNGNVPDATRILEYPVNGNADEVTALTKRILKELCGISLEEPLDIRYSEK